MLKVGINGYGRIGRCLHRQLLDEPKIEVAAINNRSTIEEYMLKYDSTHGKLELDVLVKDNYLIINSKKTKLFQESDPFNITWQGLDVIVDSTGKFKSRSSLEVHLKKAEYVILTCPPNDETPIYLPCISQQLPDSQIFSVASCTTNALAPIIKLLDEKYGISKLCCTTIHAYTGNDNLLDGSHKDPRRARSALASIRESSTGASKLILSLFPHLKEKISIKAYRVPVPNGSVLDISVAINKEVSVEELKRVFSDNEMNTILKTTTDPIVSTDAIGEKCSSLIDLNSIKKIDSATYTLTAYYDNEWGYTARLVDTIKKLEAIKDENKYYFAKTTKCEVD